MRENVNSDGDERVDEREGAGVDSGDTDTTDSGSTTDGQARPEPDGEAADRHDDADADGQADRDRDEQPTRNDEADRDAEDSEARTDGEDGTDGEDRTDGEDGANDGDAEDASTPQADDDGDRHESLVARARREREQRRRRRLATAFGVAGELLITGGIVIVLFIVYSLWWTNVVANEQARRDSDAVREAWETTPDDGDDTTRLFDPEDGIGFLHVPTMSDDDILVKEGVDLKTLNGGVAGYYDTPVESAMPWDQEGNFSLAAHRDGHGAKFHNIHKIEEGDPIVFESRNNWYIYRVFEILPKTSRYNTGVLDPVPADSGRTEPGRYITLTTCTPILTSEHRYVVWGELERVEPVDDQRSLPRELR